MGGRLPGAARLRRSAPGYERAALRAADRDRLLYRAGMAQTLTRLLVHIIFTTRLREDLIPEDFEPDLHAYIGGTCRGHGSVLLDAGGTANHIHLLVSLAKTGAVSDLLMQVKKDSTKWLKGRGVRGFQWQEGYGAFSVGASQLPALRRYFARQKEHHKRITVEGEILAFLKKYGIEYDPERIWS